MPLTQGDLLSHLVELFDYRVKEVSFVDEGANLLPFLLTKKLKVGDVKKEAFEALLKTKVKNAGRVVEVLKRADVPDEDQEAVQNVLQVLTGLKKTKSLTNKTLGDALAAAELADMTGDPTETQAKVKNAFDFIAEKIAIKMSKMLEDEHESEKKEDGDEDEEETVPDSREKADGDEDEDDEEETSSEAQDINKSRGGKGAMKLDELPLNAKGELDIVALKRAKIDAGTITVFKTLWAQNKSLTSNIDALNDKLKNEVDLRVDKHYSAEADEFVALKFEGLKDVLKNFGTACPDEYPKLKPLLKVATDALKPAAERSFEPMGGSTGGGNPGSPNEFYNVCKAKAVAQSPDVSPVIALQQYWKTEEGRKDYQRYDNLVTNR